MFTGPKWKSALYLDARANKEQADALIKIYSGKAGGSCEAAAGFISEMAGVRSIPIKFEVDGKKRSLQVPSFIVIPNEAIAGRMLKKEQQ